MSDAEYMKIHQKYFLDDIRKKYATHKLVHTYRFIYCKIKKGMYGLKQAARLAYDELKAHLTKYDYHPDKYAPNIWQHKT